MMSFTASLIGMDSFVAYLASTGRKARVVKTAAGLDDGFFSRDTNIIELQGSPIDLITMRMEGALGPRQLLAGASTRVSIGRLPIFAKQVIPLQYHYIVRTRVPFPMLEAKLQQETQGVFRKKRVGPLWWSGAFIGPKLMDDPVVMDALKEHIRVDDKLEIHAEPKRGFIRIVHACTRVFDFNLFRDEPIRVHSEYAAPSLLNAFEHIATILRTPIPRT